MAPTIRLTLFLLMPMCLIGGLPECAGGDLFPSLGQLAEESGPLRPGAASADLSLARKDKPSEEDRGPSDGGRPQQPFPEPAERPLSPEIRPAPDFQFEQMLPGPIEEAFPLETEVSWDDAGFQPGRAGLFGRQPLRRHLRAVYGSPAGRHRGLGRPLTNESWMYRPFSAGWFMGAMFGSPLIDDWLGISNGYFTGLRFGWDENYYWGLEVQFGYGRMGLWDSHLAKADRRLWYVGQGWSSDDPSLDRLINSRRDLDLYQGAVSVMYYPWGDARWRPYFSLGVGAARMKFTDIFLTHYDKTFFVLPIAVGVKYQWNDCLALRVECSDSFSVPGGGGFMSVHNVSVNGALEIRFGGARTAYWPWNPGRTYW